MATCRNCGEELEWAICDGRWQPLEPLGADLPEGSSFSYVDANGNLRADHRDHCEGQAPLAVTRLTRKVRIE